MKVSVIALGLLGLATAAPATLNIEATELHHNVARADSWLTIANKWRQKAGLPLFAASAQLQANAQKTVNDDKGTMRHELNPGTSAQVLAPGNANNFENEYVGGWLCEKPQLPYLQGVCSQYPGWDHSSGETGHADILTSPGYTKIGCAFAYGIWGCDLA